MYKLDINTFIAMLYEHQMMELFQANIPPLVVQSDTPCFVNLFRTGTRTCICVINDNTDRILYKNEQAINALRDVTLDWQAVDMFAPFVPRVWIQSIYKQAPGKVTNRKTQLVKDMSFSSRRDGFPFTESSRDTFIPDNKMANESTATSSPPEELYIAMSTFRWDASLDGITNKDMAHMYRPEKTPMEFPELDWGREATHSPQLPDASARQYQSETTMQNPGKSAKPKYPELEWTTTTSMPSIPKHYGKAAHMSPQQHPDKQQYWDNTASSMPAANTWAFEKKEQAEQEPLKWTTSTSIPSVSVQSDKKRAGLSGQAERAQQHGHNLYHYASITHWHNQGLEKKPNRQADAEQPLHYWNSAASASQPFHASQNHVPEPPQNQPPLHWDAPAIPSRPQEDRSTRQFTSFQAPQPSQQSEHRNVAEFHRDNSSDNTPTHRGAHQRHHTQSAQMNYASDYHPSTSAYPADTSKHQQTQSFPSLRQINQWSPASQRPTHETTHTPEQYTPKRLVKVSIQQMHGWSPRTRSIYSLINGVNTTEQIARLLSLPTETTYITLIQLQQNNFIRLDS